MDLLRRIMLLLVQPLSDCFDLAFQSVSGAVTTGNGTRCPRFPPSVWNIHDITVNNADRTNDFTEAWNRGFETLLSENHPSVGICIKLLQADAAQAASILLKHTNGRRRRWQQMQRRLHGLCVEYDNERRPLEYKLLSLTYKVLTTSEPSYLNTVRESRGVLRNQEKS